MTATVTGSGTETTAGAGPDGLARLLDLQARGPSAVGVMTLLDARLESVHRGHVTFSCRTRGDFANPMGTLHGGISATLLDSAMGCAVMTALPAGAAYTTVDLAVTYLRPVPLDGVVIRAEGRTIHVGGRIATASGTLTGPDDRVLATATTTCLVLPEAR
jgi:uncharacterized protein (TIGR00369 family)